MNQAKPPPIDLEKYLAGKKHRYCTYQNGARLYSMAYWPFVVQVERPTTARRKKRGSVKNSEMDLELILFY